MKNLNRTIILSFILFFIFATNLFSQNIGQGEFMIVNQTGTSTGYSITVKIYPVGAIFNGGDEYTVKAHNPIDPIYNPYIYGMAIPISNIQSGTDWYALANFDKSSPRDLCQFSLGYGRYRIDFYEGTTQTNTCDVDFSDANFTGQDITGYIQHLRMDYYSASNITFKFIGNTQEVNINSVNKYVKVWEQTGTGNTALTPSKGNFTDSQDPASQYHAFPLDATSFGHFAHVTPEEVSLNFKISNYDGNIIENKEFIISNCKFEINSGKALLINNNSNSNPQLLITGINAKLKTYNSNISLPSLYQISINNGASIISDGTNFYSDNNTIWKGIRLINPGICSITNCTLTNPEIAIRSENSGFNELKIENNVFHFSTENSSAGIITSNTKNITIKKNIFDMPSNTNISSTGVEITESANSEEENNSSDGISINIVENEFYNGCIHITIYGISDNSLPVYIDKNILTNSFTNIALLQSTGIISNNYINSNISQLNNIILQRSNNFFLKNIIYGNKHNIKLDFDSYPNFSPNFTNDGELLLVAGQNDLKSVEGNNIFLLYHTGNFYTNFGSNNFDINRPNCFHYYGHRINTYNTDYYSIGNCFYLYGSSTTPKVSLYNIDYQAMDIISQPPPTSCTIWDYQISNLIINDRGNGIFDTTKITSSENLPIHSLDEELYGTGIKNQKLKNYSAAILNFKNIINNYPNSKYREKVFTDIYDCYILSDTNHNQGWRNIIFTELVNYLGSIIQQSGNNDAITRIAFDFLLRSKIKTKNYLQAMEGYSFIAENSPFAIERLLASINYLDIEGLLQGSSGGQKETKDYNNIFYQNPNGKPIKDILLSSYKRIMETCKKNENIELMNSNDYNNTKKTQNKKHEHEKIIKNRALDNIKISSSLTKKQRRDRIQKDIKLLILSGNTEDIQFNKENFDPIKYELFQNYPNPFNPITNIKYQIQKAGLVTLKIYDITGREIKTLVNELKYPGSYAVTFNAQELSSGVYFYRIQSGDFIQVKKMILLK